MRQVHSDPKAFAKLAELVKPFHAVGRTESAALLIWFLQTMFRLDETEAQDAVCDKKHDAGVDAITVRDEQKEIVFFQAKRKQNLPATLGDVDLKEFVGSLEQFRTRSGVEKVIAHSQNDELKALLKANNVAEKVENGYAIRPVFICNIAANHDAAAYLQHAAGAAIDLWDLTRLGPVLDQLSKEWFVDEPVRLRLNGKKIFHEGPRATPTLVYAAIPAEELVRLPGIQDTRVFAQNVRLGLGNTRVNKDILGSVKDRKEHRNFLTFHNGMTIVTKEVKIHGAKLYLNHYSVCNGCQSLLTFYNNRLALTRELEVLVRVVRVGEDRKLPEVIAYRTNNQNAISLRDLSANDSGQIKLKAEFDGLYDFDTTYVIKQGEAARANPLTNEFAGRLLLAFYNRQPWSCHQKYRVFGDLETVVFGYNINAPHIRLAQLVMRAVESGLDAIKNERIRKYGLTRFVVLFLVGDVLREERPGIQVLTNPRDVLSTGAGSKVVEETLLRSIGDQVSFVVTELNYFIDEHGGEAYDYKSEFKSPKSVSALRNEVIKAYEKDKRMSRVRPFTLAG